MNSPHGALPFADSNAQGSAQTTYYISWPELSQLARLLSCLEQEANRPRPQRCASGTTRRCLFVEATGGFHTAQPRFRRPHPSEYNLGVRQGVGYHSLKHLSTEFYLLFGLRLEPAKFRDEHLSRQRERVSKP